MTPSLKLSRRNFIDRITGLIFQTGTYYLAMGISLKMAFARVVRLFPTSNRRYE